MRTVLICHDGAHLSQDGLSRWLASFSDLAGIVVLRERRSRLYARIKREIGRVGAIRFVDVMLFRAYYRLFLSKKDDLWARGKLRELSHAYPQIPERTPVLTTHSPNCREAEDFIRAAQPDVVIARCKTLLKKSIYSIPSKGTFVMHPGICPEYRNAHGCFWALARGDRPNVGMTLLKIDDGVDTGPVYGYYTYEFDERDESHIVIQDRVVLENLDGLKEKLLDIYEDRAASLDTTGRKSNVWGQPWLTAYLKMKVNARRART